ncbi:MAG: ferrous iron transport protein A [Acidobacteria bacterium]|nr:ferrous iron transport protein A [Acidobacteriota bacterium]
MVPTATSVESPGSTAVAVPLTTVPVGAVATLREVTDVDSRPVLRSLGLTDDCVLRLCQVGDPCIVQVKSTRIGLSNAVARCLYVVPEAGNR